MKKKIFSLFLCGALALITGCSSNTKTMTCTLEDADDEYKTKETYEIVYQKDMTLDKIAMSVYMEILSDEIEKEEFDSMVSTYQEFVDEINAGADDEYKGVSAKLDSDEKKLNYSITVTYDVKNMSSERLADTEFSEYVDSDLKFDIEKFQKDMKSNDSGIVCTEK